MVWIAFQKNMKQKISYSCRTSENSSKLVEFIIFKLANYLWFSLCSKLYVWVCTQSCLTLWEPTDCSPPSSSVHVISQARILEWVAISSSRRTSWPRDQTHIPYIFYIGRQILHKCTVCTKLEIQKWNVCRYWCVPVESSMAPYCW